MNYILITDTHFGVKQNSMTWLKSQMRFFNEQLIPYIKQYNKDEVRIIHLGDVFDSRSTISTYIASQVRSIFQQLTSLVDKLIIIAGNHDYYSPNSDEVDTLSLIFESIPNVLLVNKESYIDGENMYIPWYQWNHQEELQKTVDTLSIKNIFTHADIVSQKININRCDIYSGHIHIPYIKGRIRNLGSCYALNFSDANTPRGFYVLKNNKLSFIENNQSIKFHRLYNDDIFKYNLSNFGVFDYIELYINQNNLSKENYIIRINDFMKNFKYIWVIPQSTILENSNEIKFEGYDIATIAKELIPEDLQDKFNIIINSVNQ